MKTTSKSRTVKQIGYVIGLAVFGTCASGQANAAAYAFAQNTITNLTLTPMLGFSGISTESTITAAQWFGYPASSFLSTTTNGGASDAAQAMAGPGPFPAANTFAAGMLASDGSRGDAFTSANSPGVFPNFNSVAEARAVDGLSGAGDGRNTSHSLFQLTSAGTITASYNFAVATRSFTTAIGEVANASVLNTVTIYNSAGQQVFTSAPNAVNFACDSADGMPAGGCSNLGTGTLSITSGTLAAGMYSFDLSSTSQVNVLGATVVPEPETYALMLAGLSIVGCFARRGRKI